MEYREFIIRHKNQIIVGVAVAIALIVIAYYLTMHGKNGGDLLVAPPSSGRSAFSVGDQASGTVAEYGYTEAPKHIGERATIRGTVVKTFTAKSGVTFFDFCQGFDSCPFSAVIFASDLGGFGDLKKYERAVKLTGVIKSYQGNAEMTLNSPEQIE